MKGLLIFLRDLFQGPYGKNDGFPTLNNVK